MNTTYSESYHEHDRTSCNDENLNNIDPDGSGCRRCNALLFDQYFSLQKEAQAWKRDAERYHEIRSRLTGQAYDPRYFEDLFTAGCMGHPDAVDGEVDAVMEQKT